ncbi:MAG: phosphatidylinositol phosphate synthase [Nocardioides sp.]
MVEPLRALVGAVVTPLARLLLRLGISPDAVTVAGSLGVCASALILAPRGHLVAAAFAVAGFALFDALDGTMARLQGRTDTFGAFLDSTMDRVADAAVFAALTTYFVDVGEDFLAGLSLYCLVVGSLTSYARARAEGVGLDARVGIAERADRLILLGLVVVLSDWLHTPWILPAGLWLLAIASTVTVVQRVLVVRRQARALVQSSGGD